MLVHFEKKTIQLPDFFIVGAAKSGTTSVAYYLNQHPEIEIPVKEPGYFHLAKNSESHYRNVFRMKVYHFDEYLKLYRDINHAQKIGDASTIYLDTYETTIKNLKHIYANSSHKLKVIIFLRNPLARAYSDYLYKISRGLEKHRFEEVLHEALKNNKSTFHYYLETGKYYNKVEAYKQNFPQTRVYLFEELNDPKRLLQNIFEFLEVKIDVKINTNIKTNPSGIPRNRTLIKLLRSEEGIGFFIRSLIPKKQRPAFAKIKYFMLAKLLVKSTMSESSKNILTRYYQEDIIKLQELLDKDLSHWIE